MYFHVIAIHLKKDSRAGVEECGRKYNMMFGRQDVFISSTPTTSRNQLHDFLYMCTQYYTGTLSLMGTYSIELLWNL